MFKIDSKLQDLTNKFIKEFLDLAHELNEKGRKRDDDFHFIYDLSQAIAYSDYTRIDKDTILMSMSSFDNEITKHMFNLRIQGFTEMILSKVEAVQNGYECDDYFIKNIVTSENKYEDLDITFNNEGDINELNTIERIGEQISFDVSNSRSGFKGNVVIKKQHRRIFDGENFVGEELKADSINFYVGGQQVMTIDYKPSFKDNTYKEVGTYHHLKYIADINSFYIVINNL